MSSDHDRRKTIYIHLCMTYYIFLESAGQNLVNERYCNIPSISNASFGHERSGSPSPNGLFFIYHYFFYKTQKYYKMDKQAVRRW